MRLSSRVSNMTLSLTLALDARAKDLMASGRSVVNMSVGEPDFSAPAAARAAASAKIQSGDVKYTAANGTPGLRAALARHLESTRGGRWSPAQITVCHSAKHALSGALLALVEPGDEILLSLPTWLSYVEQIALAGGQPVQLAPLPGCRPDLAAIRRALTPRTRGFLLNTPANPTGYVWTRAELEELMELARQHDLWVLSDEIYRRLVYEGEPFCSPASLGEDARARTVIVDGASKTYAMTGYRIGYVAGPEPLAAAVMRLHSQMTGSPNSISQAAFQAALETPGGEPPEVAGMAAEFSRRRRRLVQGLRDLGLATPEPRGAFYAFPDVSPYLDARGSLGFCQDLLEREGLSLVPGCAFGMDQHVRLSYSLSFEQVEEALRRLGVFLKSLQRTAH